MKGDHLMMNVQNSSQVTAHAEYECVALIYLCMMKLQSFQMFL